MSQDIQLGAAGLYTGPNALKRMEGALLEADDVMSVRPDLLEYRPGFKRDASCALNVSGYRPESLIPFDGDLLVYSENVAHTASRFDWADSEVNLSGTSPRALHSFAPPRGAVARKNLYVTTKSGTFKVCNSDATDGIYVGLVRPTLRSVSHVTASAVAVSNAYSYSHRFCVRRTDTNEVITRSPPSVSYPRTNNTGVTADPTFTVWTVQAVEGDVIEVYRTKTRVGNTAAVRRAVGAEFFLAQEYRVTAADESAGYASIQDNTLDADLGAALYTNPSREGELRSNDFPPTGGDIAQWKNCLWWANTRPQQRIARAVVDAGATRTDNGLTYVAKTGLTITITSPTITGFADTDEIHVGMALSDAANDPTVSAQFAATSRVLSKTATTVTMTTNATGSAGPVTRYFYDVVRVGMGVSVGTPTSYEVFAAGTSGTRRFDSDSGTARDVARELVYAINEMLFLDGLSFVTAQSFGEDAFTVPPGTVVLEQVGAGTFASTLTNLEFACSAPAGFADQPAWPAYFSRTTATWEERNALRYSKPDQPEHVPYTNVLYVGASNFHTLRIIPLESSLIVFREDGIFRVTGEAPDSWTVTPLDAQTRLLCSSAVDAMGNKAYAWTDRGVIAVSENGVQPLSEPVVGMGDAADELKAMRQSFTRGNTILGCFLVAWPTRGLVCLAVPQTSASGYSYRWWVHSLPTGTWSRFILGARCAAFDAERNAMYRESGLGSYFELRKERTGYDDDDMADDEHTITVASVPSSTTFTAALASVDRWTPEAGDMLSFLLGGSQPGGLTRVVSASDNNGAGPWTITVESTVSLVAGAATAIKTIPAAVAWRPVYAESPKRGMLLSEAAFAFREVTSAIAWRVFFGARTDREATTQETTIAVSTAESVRQTAWARCWPGRAVGRCAHLYPRMRIRDRVRWHLALLALDIKGAQAGRVRK